MLVLLNVYITDTSNPIQEFAGLHNAHSDQSKARPSHQYSRVC